MYELRCKDAGFDCAGVVKGQTPEEVLQRAAVHASEVHQVQVTPEMAKQIATLIRDDSGAAPPAEKTSRQ